MGLSGRVLVVLGDEDGYADRSFGNLPHVQTMVAGELNAYDILVNDWVVFTDETLPGGAGGDGRSSPAGDAAEEAGDTVVAGAVLTTSPTGTARYGSTVAVISSKGHAPLAVPAVSGTYATAAPALTAAGFVPTQQNTYNATAPKGQAPDKNP